VFQPLRRSASSRTAHRSVRLVVEELESRNLLSAGSAIAQPLLDVPSVSGQASVPDEERVAAPVASAAQSATVIASLDTTDWQRMVENSWGCGTEHSISSELARTVHYAKADVMDAGVLGNEPADDTGLMMVQNGGGIDVSADVVGEMGWE
jgi:hypothetical protein